MSKIISASFCNEKGNVTFEDGTIKEMTLEEYKIYKRGIQKFKSIADLTRYVSEKGGFYNAGWNRHIKSVWTDQDFYWFHGKDLLTKEEYKNMMQLIKRYQRFYKYIKEVLPQWEKVSMVYYADNSEYEVQQDKNGNKFEKFNYSTASYESFDYEDIRKFFDFNN